MLRWKTVKSLHSNTAVVDKHLIEIERLPASAALHSFRVISVVVSPSPKRLRKSWSNFAALIAQLFMLIAAKTPKLIKKLFFVPFQIILHNEDQNETRKVIKAAF